LDEKVAGCQELLSYLFINSCIFLSSLVFFSLLPFHGVVDRKEKLQLQERRLRRRLSISVPLFSLISISKREK
jgi:hypothetical protein